MGCSKKHVNSAKLLSNNNTELSNKKSYIDNRLIEGKWELASDPTACFVFYANTWRFLDNNDSPVDMGIFLLEDDYLILKMEDNDVRIKYTKENNSIIFSEHSQEWMNDRWNKVVVQEQSSIHPLIGTWKGEITSSFGDKRILLFQYFNYDPETKIGEGLHYSFEPTFTKIRISMAIFSGDFGIITSQPITATLLNDGINEQKIILERDDNEELVSKIRIEEYYEIVGDELIMKNRGNLICKKI